MKSSSSRDLCFVQAQGDTCSQFNTASVMHLLVWFVYFNAASSRFWWTASLKLANLKQDQAWPICVLF